MYHLSIPCLNFNLNSYLRDKKNQPKDPQNKMNEQLSTEGSVPNVTIHYITGYDEPATAIYDSVEDASGYQGLGELSQQVHYGQLK